jgi:adenosylmethionine-8-amino-7-oxononanoate aminotransferase
MVEPRSKFRSSLVARDLAVVWHPCGSQRDYLIAPPIEVVSASGSMLTLADGRQIIDGISSWWCKALGHGHPRLRTALIEQAQRFEHVILANTTNDGIVRLSERLCALCNTMDSPGMVAPTTGPFNHVFYAGDGSCGVEVALKMAVQAQAQGGQPQRTRFAALANGYHGETVGALSVSDCGLYNAPFSSMRFPCTMLGPLPYRSGSDDARWSDAGLEWEQIESQLAPIAGELAAIIVEPLLQAAGGMRLYAPELLRHLRRWADAHQVFLIADEIASGMGRLGTMLASHQAGISADFVILSKALTGGFLPLSAVVTTDEIYQRFDGQYHQGRGFMHSHTFSGNALATAVANAVLDVFAEEPILEGVARQGALMRQLLAAGMVGRPQLHGLRGMGMMVAVDLRGRDGSALDPAARTAWRVCRGALGHGALLRPLGDTLYLFPPLTATREELERLVSILLLSCDEVCGDAGGG